MVHPKIRHVKGAVALARYTFVPRHTMTVQAEARSGQSGAKPLRIAHFSLGRVNPEAADGIDKTIFHLSRGEAELGHSVRLFSVTNKPPIPIPGVAVSTYRCLVPSRLLFTRRLRDLLCWRSPFNLPSRLVAELLAWEPHVLHLHGVHVPQHVILGARMRRAGVPYCVSLHGMLAGPARGRHRWLKRVAAIWERPFLGRAAFVHVLSEAEGKDIASYGAAGTVVIAPNGIDVHSLPAPTSDSRSEAYLGPTNDEVIFLFLGRLDPAQKGLDLLLQGWSQAGLPGAKLVLVGPDWRHGQAALETLAGRLGIRSRVVFAGPAFGQQKIDLLARASVFVHTSRWEGLAFSILEAAALGKPCLLSSAADPEGRFAAAGAAIAVEPTPESIATGLRRFAGMTEPERAAMGRRARALVEDRFGWKPTARLLIQAYRQFGGDNHS
jgi:glycosyltransferase involved in cell wall biosynthesis